MNYSLVIDGRPVPVQDASFLTSPRKDDSGRFWVTYGGGYQRRPPGGLDKMGHVFEDHRGFDFIRWSMMVKKCVKQSVFFQ